MEKQDLQAAICNLENDIRSKQDQVDDKKLNNKKLTTLLEHEEKLSEAKAQLEESSLSLIS